MKDDELISALKSGGALRKQALKQIFENPSIKEAVRKNLTKYRARIEPHFPKVKKMDLDSKYEYVIDDWVNYFFIEAIVVLEKKVRDDTLRAQSFKELLGFLAVTAQNICIDWLRRLRPTEQIQPGPNDPPTDTKKEYMDKHRLQMLKKVLESLGKNCLQVLLLAAQGYSGVEIAKKLKLGNEDVVKSTRSRCRKDLKNRIDNDPDLLDLFEAYR